MPIPLLKKKIYKITERGNVKTSRTPRNTGKTSAVRKIHKGFMDAKRADPRSKMNKFITVVKQREAIKDYYNRLDLLKEMRKEADRKGDWEFDERGVEIGQAMGRKHKHKTRRKNHRRKRKSHRRKTRRR